MEEIARVYGYDRIPEALIADELPPQYGDPSLEREEMVRDLLVGLGLQEVITYRLTSPEREALQFPPGASPDDRPYVRLANPIASDRRVMRHSLLASVLEVVERNARVRDRMALFEIGPVFLASEESILPDEPLWVAIVLVGPRDLVAWHGADKEPMDFYDLKGVVDALLGGLHVDGVDYEPVEHPSFHPGKCARVVLDGQHLGVLGEIHPRVREAYDLADVPVQAAEFNLDAILARVPESHAVAPVPSFPPVLEDLAVVVEESVPAGQVEAVLREAGEPLLAEVRLFDLYRGDQVGAGKKSLAYSMVYQAPDRTLTDEEVATVRARIIRQLEDRLGARLRS
jgi:phenylalanyl-tRNA synthetase beta chain